MTLYGAVRRNIASLFGRRPSLTLPGEGEQPAYRDTLAAIHDLSRLVRNDPEAVDIYLALGNLFRAQGDIERAVKIRESIIARPGLNQKFKARSYFELGQDYQRAGIVDRALTAFRQATQLGYSREAVTLELAGLFAQSGEFEKAAEEYGRLNFSLGQAHYMVRQAEELLRDGQEGRAEKLIKKALRTYPGSAEAWSATLRLTALSRSWKKTAALLERALDSITPGLRFLAIDALLEAGKKDVAENDAAAREDARLFASELCGAVIPVLERQEPHILLHYYGALLLERAQDIDAVDVWLAKALVVQPDFWAARLRSLVLSERKHEVPPVVGMQITYLAEELRHIRRFVCSVCGLRENRVFYRCRRCGSWHSLSFRLSLQD